MEKEKVKKMVIGLVVVLLVLSLGYYIGNQDPVSETENGEDEVVEEDINLTRDSYLYRAGSGGELGGRDEGTEVDVFEVGDYMGISMHLEVSEPTQITTNLLNESQLEENDDLMPAFNAYESDEGGSGMSLCCGAVPVREGSYYVQVMADGNEIEVLPFEVVEETDQQ